MGVIKFFFPLLVIYNSFCQSPQLLQELQYLEKDNLYTQKLPMIGLYDSSLYYEDHIENSNYKSSLSINDSFQVISFFKDNIIRKILDTNNIIILNEAHHFPYTRTTLYHLIDSLKKYDYNYVFLEGLNQSNLHYLMQHPPGSDDGFYPQEIVYAEILRKLKQKGLYFYGYDTHDYNDKQDIIIKKNRKFLQYKIANKIIIIQIDNYIDSLYNLNNFTRREVVQALSIASTIKYYKIKKAFVFCGHGHGTKSFGLMGEILERMTKCCPFVIDQTIFREHSDSSFQSPIYTKFQNEPSPFILLKKDNFFIRAFKNNKTLVDLYLFLPKSLYLNNRPNWLCFNGEKMRYPLNKFIDISNISPPYLVKITDEKEFQQVGDYAAPVDIFQVLNYTNYDLILRPNSPYRIHILKNKKYIINTTFYTK